jgi:hypothetical protein
MASVAGASRYLLTATLANTKGLAAQSSVNFLSGTSTASLLESGRNISNVGIGISSSARALNNQLLGNSTAVNTLFSLSAATGASTDVDAARQQILAIRSRTPDSQLSRQALAEKYGIDTGGISESSTGTTVDEEA